MHFSRRSMFMSAGAGLLMPRMATAQVAPATTRDKIAAVLPELDNVIRAMLKQTGVPGLAVAIVYRDEVLSTKGFGVRQVSSPELVNADTVFQLASMSKPVASTVVAAVVGDGLATWDDPIVKHLSEFAMPDAWVTREVTLRDMFCHRSGLPHHAGDALEDIGYDRADVLHRLRYVKSATSFRSQYAYTNFGLTAAAVAAARASGKSWEDLSAERLYRPLGMASTSSRFKDFMAAANRASGHVKQDGAWVAKYTREPDAQSPAGGVSSSARDLAQWLRLQVGRGSINGRSIVNGAALDETHRPQIVSGPAVNPMVDHSSFYGLGWGVNYDERGTIRWSHSGAFNLGAGTCVNVIPSEQLAIAVVTNAFPTGVAESVCRIFLDLALTGKIERDWLALFGPALAATMAPDYGTAVDYAKPPQRPTAALATGAYAGQYHSDLYGLASILESSDGLALTLGPKPNSYALRHYDRDVFTYQPTGENAYGPSAVTFQVGAVGSATSVMIENLDLGGQGRLDRVR
jgi:CubicO group peptidase (beta-lactamase class C family)